MAHPKIVTVPQQLFDDLHEYALALLGEWSWKKDEERAGNKVLYLELRECIEKAELFISNSVVEEQGEKGMEEQFVKPSIEQVAWVFNHLRDHLKEGGTYRCLIYDRLGFDLDSYTPLFLAGGMSISNAFNHYAELTKDGDLPEPHNS